MQLHPTSCQHRSPDEHDDEKTSQHSLPKIEAKSLANWQAIAVDFPSFEERGQACHQQYGAEAGRLGQHHGRRRELLDRDPEPSREINGDWSLDKLPDQLNADYEEKKSPSRAQALRADEDRDHWRSR